MDVQPITVAFPVQKVKKLNKENLVDGKLYGLPDGWRVELRPRNGDYQGKVDQFFYAPGTNKQFRSIKSIEKQFNIKVEKPIINSLGDDNQTPDQGLKRDHSEASQRSKPESSQRAKKKCKFELKRREVDAEKNDGKTQSGEIEDNISTTTGPEN